MALLCGLCEVLFDVDAGNQVQQCVPAGAFSEAELADIAFSAFPVSFRQKSSLGASACALGMRWHQGMRSGWAC